MKNIFLFSAILISSFLQAQTFTPSDKESKVHFVIKNFGINTGGDITGMKGKIKFNAKKPSACSFDVTADISTIDTDNEKRDEHLKTIDFFDIEKYPGIRIESIKIEPGSDLKHFTFKGKLTIKNVTKNIEFPFTAEGKPGGALFTGDFEIKRSDYGIGKEGGTMSDKVKVSLSVFGKAG